MHFEATGWSDYPFELELDGKSVKYKDVLERFGQEETDAAMSRAYEDGEFSD